MQNVDFSGMSDDEFWAYVETLGTIPATDAIRLHHEMGRRQRHKGMTAAQFKVAAVPPEGEWQAIAKDHKDYLRKRKIINPVYLRAAYVTIGVIGWAFLDSAEWTRWLAGGLALVDAYSTIRDDGYIEGLRAGIYDGVVRGRGLTPEEIDDFNNINNGVF